jgi:hypothetical protein
MSFEHQKKFIIITTINKETEAIKKFSKMKDWEIILVGDKKSKEIKSRDNITFLSIEDQKKLNFRITKYLPYNHYSRKNIGYLYAIKNGADIIYDTDDDNLPYKDWKFPNFKANKITTAKSKYINVYKYYSTEKIWPRGYPLDEINKKVKTNIIDKKVKVGVWQGLADQEPDVDAIFRLTVGKQITFEGKEPIILDKNIYCPFNSQNTLWKRELFPFLYFPSTVSFRFTDILRGYITQKLLWQANYNLGFTKATVYQKRNAHNFMKDFKDEVEMYLNVKPIVEILDNLKLSDNYLHNLEKTYLELEKNNFVKNEELTRCVTWIKDIKKYY